jgi:tetratricopeptide (TPR) repeat protein
MPDLAAVKAEALSRHRAGDLAGAERLYRSLLAAAPDDAEILHFLGVLLHQRGDHRAAALCMRRALAQRPDRADTHSNLGLALEALGTREMAVEHYRRALALNPGFAVAHSNLGRTLEALGRTDEARACYEHALALDPQLVEAQNNLANLLQKAGRGDEAMALYERALVARPASADIHRNLGLALQAQGRLDAALLRFEEAARLAPDAAWAHFDIANLLRAKSRLDEARSAYERALALDPNHADTHCNLGIALHLQGNLDAARASFDRAIALDGDHANAHLNRGMNSLLMGDFGGFADYEWRFRAHAGIARPDVGVAQWQGETLAGATILLHAEQGFGDAIQFLRYVPPVARRGGRVVLMLPPELTRLAAGMRDAAAVVETGAPVPDLAWHAPLMSLPLVLGAPLTTEQPYLVASPALVERWRARLAAHRGVRVGLAWTGRPSHPRDGERSLAPALLAPLASVPGVAFFALRKGADAPLPAGLGIDDLGPALGDFADTAAVIASLDLVIAVDTAVAHLAGALGKPVWVMLTRVPDWRWMVERADSPWYPTMRLFRQDEARAWPPVIARVTDALRALAD